MSHQDRKNTRVINATTRFEMIILFLFSLFNLHLQRKILTNNLYRLMPCNLVFCLSKNFKRKLCFIVDIKLMFKFAGYKVFTLHPPSSCYFSGQGKIRFLHPVLRPSLFSNTCCYLVFIFSRILYVPLVNLFQDDRRLSGIQCRVLKTVLVCYYCSQFP